RNVRTLLLGLAKYLSLPNAKKHYLDVLQDFVTRINHRCNSSIGARPTDIVNGGPIAEEIAWKALYANDEAMNSFAAETYKYPVGTKVRYALNRAKNTFWKGYNVNWTSEIYIITRHVKGADAPTYELSDPKTHKPLDRIFYEAELNP